MNMMRCGVGEVGVGVHSVACLSITLYAITLKATGQANRRNIDTCLFPNIRSQPLDTTTQEL